MFVVAFSVGIATFSVAIVSMTFAELSMAVMSASLFTAVVSAALWQAASDIRPAAARTKAIFFMRMLPSIAKFAASPIAYHERRFITQANRASIAIHLSERFTHGFPSFLDRDRSYFFRRVGKNRQRGGPDRDILAEL